MPKQTPQLQKKFIDDIKANLLKEKERIEKELGTFTEKNSHTVEEDYDTVFPEYGDKSDENAQEITDFLANKPLEMSLEKTLRDINNALERIDEGTYGTCKYCKEHIDEKRLVARPTSSACISCKKTLTQEA